MLCQQIKFSVINNLNETKVTVCETDGFVQMMACATDGFVKFTLEEN